MTKEEINKLKVGDKIEINTYHFRSGRLKGTRIITAIYEHEINKIMVRCFGWDRFQLKPNEIIEKIS
jgi:hypothetical protein